MSKSKKQEDPIEQWKEWLDNRYNPGYFLGGRIHPVYRATGTGAGIFLLISGTLGAAFIITAFFYSEDTDESKTMFLFEMIISVVMIFAGLTKIAEGKKKRKGKK